MKICIKDHDIFDSEDSISLEKVSPIGIVFDSTLSHDDTSLLHYDESLEGMLKSSSLEIDCDDINRLNIILNDHDCSDAFFEEICQNLENDGIVFQTTKSNQAVNQGNSTVITLDQQYSSGSSTLIFAPYDNTRLGDSDSLAISMQTAFQQNGFFANDILSGKVGFREDSEGNVSGIVPTDTEEAIDSTTDTSFITISLGTHNVNAELVAKSIESGLARQSYYLDNYYSQTDLLYRAKAGEAVEVVADYFGTTVHDLTQCNHLSDLDTLDAQTVINPIVQEMNAFNKNIEFSVAKSNTKVC